MLDLLCLCSWHPKDYEIYPMDFFFLFAFSCFRCHGYRLQKKLMYINLAGIKFYVLY